MSDSVQDPSAKASEDHQMGAPESIEKGKGKMAEMEDDDDESEEDSAAEDHGDVEEADDDNMEEIDETNIVGSRTRGKNIDFAEAAKNMEDDDDEDDDDDFEDPDQDGDKMEE